MGAYAAPDPNATGAIQNPHTINAGWRGAKASQADFWPGEFQKDYVFVKSNKKPTPQDILNGMRSGNSFVVQGDLIRGLDFTAKASGPEAHMGEKLVVGPNQKVKIKVRVYLPDVNNNCPYANANPALAQVNINQSLNRPVLHHIDLIGGSVTGKVQPGTPEYTQINSDASIKQTVLVFDMKDEGNGWKSFTYVFKPSTSCYFRLRGTNLPANTPYETDAQGNPLSDSQDKNISFKGATLGNDVAAWSDLWFYSNPIFIRVTTGPNF